jgi:3-oxoacyl-[acyl-carrier-protein] synthase-3
MARIAQIVSTARYLPEHVVTNAELTARFAALGRPDVINKLAARTGINQRFYAPKDWVTSDLALAAAKEALKRAGRKPEDVDLVILGNPFLPLAPFLSALIFSEPLRTRRAQGKFGVIMPKQDKIVGWINAVPPSSNCDARLIE